MSDWQPEPSRSTVTFTARGHADIRATHDKTIELIAGPHITARATCVVGVSAELPVEALRAFRGPVVIEIEAAAATVRVHALANPRFTSTDRMVVRRSDHRSPETFATGADASASDFDRDLVHALADPAQDIRITVSAADAPPLASAEVVVLSGLIGTPSPDGDEARALTSAALVLAAGGAAPQVERLTDAPVVTGADGLGEARAALAQGAVVVTAGDPLRDDHVGELLHWAVEHDVVVRVVGENDPRMAALLMSGVTRSSYALLGAPPSSRRGRDAALGGVAAVGVVAVWEARTDALAELLDGAAERWATSPAVVLLAPGEADETYVRGHVADVRDVLRSEAVGRGSLVVDLAEAGTDGGEELAPFLRALLEYGVSSRTLTDALQHLPGMARRDAYDLVHAVKDALRKD